MGNGNIMPVEGVRIILMKPGLYVTFLAAGQAVSISFITYSTEQSPS